MSDREMTAVAVKEQGMMQMVVSPTFQAMMKQALPKVGLTPARLTRIVATEFRKTPALARCTPGSFYRSVMQCAELGLIPGGAQGFCWLIPYGKEATFVLGYKGACHLAWRTMMLNAIDAHFVWEGDHFNYSYGTRGFIEHRPTTKVEERGAPVGVWAELWPKGADRSMFRFMSYDECIAFRKRYVKSRSGPWHEPPETNDFQWMCMKTVLKQLLKLGPTSSEVGQAIYADDRADLGEAVPAELDVTAESELIEQMMDEGGDVNDGGGFTGEEGAAAAEVVEQPKVAENPCGGPHDCIRETGHKGACMDLEGETWTPEG